MSGRSEPAQALRRGTLPEWQQDRRDRMVTAMTVLAAALWAICFALMAIIPDAGVRAMLLIVGIGFVLVSAALPALRENHKRRRSDRLGVFIGRALELARACDDGGVDFVDTKKTCDVLGNEMDTYVKAQFGPGAVEHLNNSNGVSAGIATGSSSERRKYGMWCRFRAARLSEFIAGLHRE